MASAQHERRLPPARPPPPDLSAVSASPHLSPALDLTAHTWSFRDMQRVHDMAYRLVDAGLRADETGDLETAAASYTEGLRLLDRALRVDCAKLAHCTREQIDQAKDLQAKMNKTRQQTAYRLQMLQRQNEPEPSPESIPEASTPPSYEEAMSQPSSPPPYEDELTALGESLTRRELSSPDLAVAEELFSISDGVQIYYITGAGLVSAPTYPTSLHIVRLVNGPQDQELTTVFLHVGDWVYPLIPGTSPVLHTNYGAYLFPEMAASAEPGAAVGLMIPDSLSQAERDTFEEILQSLTLFEEQSPEVRPPEEGREILAGEKREAVEGEEEETAKPLDTAGKISKGIQIAADWIVWGVEKGAEKAGELIRRGSLKLQEKCQPSGQPYNVDPKVQKGIIYAREATNGAVKVTGYIVKKLGALTVAIAREMAPHVRKQGAKILPKSMTVNSKEGKATLDGVLEVAASGLRGFGTVYLGLEAAAKSLGRVLADETSHVVSHRYGPEAGCLTQNAMYTAGNVVMAAHNIKDLGAKAVAKRAAKETTKAVVMDWSNSKTKQQSSQPGVTKIGSEVKSNPSLTDKKQPPDD